MLRKSTLLSVILVSSLSANAALLSNAIVNPANGHSYYLTSPGTWVELEAEAVTLGGHLVTINNQQEQDWVFSTFGLYGGIERPLWIGLTDEASEGNWQWASGEPVTFTLWDDGEPNGSGQLRGVVPGNFAGRVAMRPVLKTPQWRQNLYG